MEFEGASIGVYVHRKERQQSLWGHPEPIRSIELTANPWHLSLLKKLINQAMQFSVEQDRSMLQIYQMSNSWWRPWDKAASKEPRAFDTVILDQDTANDILADAKKFVSMEERTYYMKRGIPYHRGYLFYGPPGTGKTSFAQALAGSIKSTPMDICLLNLASQNLDDAKLNSSLRYAPKNAIILLEDVDAVFVQRSSASLIAQDSSRPGNKPSGVSFSGLLNAIDGVASQEGRIFIMTTNHPEKLDPALVRDGRCDRKWEFGNCSSEQLRRMFKISFRDLRANQPVDDLAAAFAKQIAANSMAPAAIQGYLLPHRDPREAADPKNVQVWLVKTDKNKAVKHVTLEDHLRKV